MAGRRTRAEQVEHNRGLVLTAAREVFRERGYDRATVDAIAEAAGFSKGVVYSQFGAKADLFLALLEARIEERARQHQASSGALEMVRAIAQRSEADAEWGRLLIEFRAAAFRDPELNERYAALHERTVDRLASALEEAGEPLAIPARDLALFFLALDAGTTLERAADPDALPLEVIEDFITAALGTRAPQTT